MVVKNSQDSDSDEKIGKIEQVFEKRVDQIIAKLENIYNIEKQIAIINERQDRYVVEITALRSELSGSEHAAQVSQDRLSSKLEINKESVEAVRDELQKWLNRGWGAWAAFTILLTGVEWMTNQNFVEFKSSYTESLKQIKRLESKIADLENNVTALMAFGAKCDKSGNGNP